MSLAVGTKVGIKFLQVLSPGVLAPATQIGLNLQIVRHRRTKHFDPKWKWFRTQKYVKIEIPNLNENPEDLSPDEVRSRMKKQGLVPPRPWSERPMFVSCTGGVFEPYVPPEGDGKFSLVSKKGAKQKVELLEKKTKSMMAIRKIRSYEEDFEPPEFCEVAQEIYNNVHELMAKRDLKGLQEKATERAYPEITHNIQKKTIKWKFLGSIEPPRVVHARCTDIVTKDNIFAQITVRFHNQQLLAIYDRFGRLIHGSEILAKDVVEYVVFEKNISNEYGKWRLHAKIIPDWMPPPEPGIKTYVQPLDEEEEIKEVTPTETSALTPQNPEVGKDSPTLATA